MSKSMCKENWEVRMRPVAAAAALAVGVCGGAMAFEIDAGNPDIQLRWDNTVRYNYVNRVQGQNQAILNNPNTDDGDRNFGKGTVSNRFDLVSELDFVYRKKHGFRVTGATWYDAAYRGGFDNTSLATSNHLVNGQPALGLNHTADRLYRKGGELQDAFVFSGIDFGDQSLNWKLGRHIVYWGESLQVTGLLHGIAYSQGPVDIGKALAVPGSEAKELFRPLNSLSAQLQMSEKFSLAMQALLDFEPNRLPESGTFMGSNDAAHWGGESLINPGLPGGRAYRGNDILPDKKTDWGISARWTPDWLDGTAGLVYRNFSDRTPQVVVVPGAASIYHFAYAQNVDLFGLSLSKNIHGISLGAEISHRRNMPLVSDPVVVTAAMLPKGGDLVGARGNTLHALVNLLGTMSKTPVFDTASWYGELTYSRWLRVTQGASSFKGRDTYTALDRVSKDAWQLSLGFTPTWFQVSPGIDLSMPLVWSGGIAGNSSVALGGNNNAGSSSVGLAADIFQRYKVDLKYTRNYGDMTVVNGVATVFSGTPAPLSDRGNISLTLRTTF